MASGSNLRRAQDWEHHVPADAGGASCVPALWVHPAGDPDVKVLIGTANWTSGDYRTLYQPFPVPVAFPANEALYLRMRMSIVGSDMSQGCALQGTSMMMTTEQDACRNHEPGD